MAASILSLTAPLDKAKVLADLYTLGGLFGLPVPAMQVGEPIPTVLAKVVEWFVDDIWNPNVVPALRAPFLDWATGDWLTLVAALVYNRPRIAAQSGTGPIDVENRSTISGTVTIGIGTVRVKNTLTGATYTNTTASSVFQWSGSGVYPKASPAMTFEADVVGTASNALTSQIAAYPIPPSTSPSVGLYAITNGNPILGSDEERDERLVARCRASVQSVSTGGPRGAYYDAATNPGAAFTSRNLPAPASWGTRVPAITRIRIVDLGGAALVVRCASDSGPAAGTVGNVDSDLGMANAAIQMWCAPPGFSVTVATAFTLLIPLGTITLDVSAESRVTDTEAIATATAALDAFFSTLPIGGAFDVASSTQGYVFYKALVGVLTRGPGVVNVTISGITAGVDTAVGGSSVAVPTVTAYAANIVSQGA